MTSADVPVLIIAWRRPNTLRQLIDALRTVAPSKLFIACDGANPERPGEKEKVSATRTVIENEIDWPCKIKRLYFDVNQGCSEGPIRAITWFFENVKEGIILEDDCVPHQDFFAYCAELLDRYRLDSRVWCISGNNYLCSSIPMNSSYFFSRYTLTWGWATWKDRWQEFDPLLLRWPLLRDSGLLPQIFDNPYEAAYWAEVFERTYRRDESITWWDYQWLFAALSRGALTATPVSNLVSNIGFGEDATHTLNPNTPIQPVLPLGPITHPDFVVRHRDADHYTYANHYGGIRRRRLRTVQARIARRWTMLQRWLGLR